jgi:hypothetical protein
MTLNLGDTQYWLKSGDFETGIWSLKDGFLENGKNTINISNLLYCKFVKDEHSTSQSGIGRIAGGIIGGVLLGPVGAIGGLLSGGRKRIDETIIICAFSDQKSFIAESTQVGAAHLIRIAEINLRGSQNASINNNNYSSELSEEQYECPECAEVIKKKAKICRYCGAQVNFKFDTTETASKDIGEIDCFKYFISDYKSQVENFCFKDEEAIKKIIRSWFNIEKEAVDSSDEIKKILSKEFNVKISNIDELAHSVVFIPALIDSCYERMKKNSTPSDAELKIEFVEFFLFAYLKEIQSRSIPERNHSNNEAISEVISKLFFNKKHISIDHWTVRAVLRSIPMKYYSLITKHPFYIIENFIVLIDEKSRGQS